MTTTARATFVLGLLLGAGVAVVLLAPAGVRAAGPGDFSEVVHRVDPSIVHVTTILDDRRPAGSRDDAVGAGFVLREDGYVATSRHVVGGARTIHVAVPGRGVHQAVVVGQDEATDLAVLKVPLDGLVPLAIGDARSLRVGSWVLAVGSPFHLPHSWSVGIVSGLGRSGLGIQAHGYEDFIQTDAAANLGNSGGPLLDADGRAVGMMTAILSRTGRSEGISLAIPIDVVADAARRILEGGAPSRPELGLVVRETDLRGGGGQGLLITRFQPGSPGPGAGLRVGDLIVEVAGQPVRRVADLQRAVWEAGAGATVEVIVVRGGQRLRALLPAR